MRSTTAATAAALTLLLAGCGSAASDSGSDSGDTKKGDSKGKPAVELVASGFGQSDEYVQGIAVVTTDDEAAIGESVTVSMNFLAEDGSILGTEEQVEGFNWVGQELVLPVWLDLSENPKANVTKIETSVSISDYGSADDPQEALEAVPSTKVAKGEYGEVVATFELSNKGSDDLTDPRIGVVCYDSAKKIIGGSSEYPSLVAAGKTIRLDVDVTTTGTPANCMAYPNYDVV